MRLKLKAILATLAIMTGITLGISLIFIHPPLLIYLIIFLAIWYITFLIYTVLLDIFKERNKHET